MPDFDLDAVLNVSAGIPVLSTCCGAELRLKGNSVWNSDGSLGLFCECRSCGETFLADYRAVTDTDFEVMCCPLFNCSAPLDNCGSTTDKALQTLHFDHHCMFCGPGHIALCLVGDDPVAV